MLVVLTDAQLFPPQVVCQTCLLADPDGFPRLHGGQLCCGTLVRGAGINHPQQYRCEMGFRLAEVSEHLPHTTMG